VSAHPLHVAIIGGGPSGLMAAEVVATAGVTVTIYDQMPAPGRKFLLAGRGGLNLTHSENLEFLLQRYGAAKLKLTAAIEAFSPTHLRAWAEELKQPTFVGSSGRVFPVAMKASPLLRAWLRRLNEAGVVFKLRHRWTGWDESGCLKFTTPEGLGTVKADATLLALGGASWPRVGSDGAWTEHLARAGVVVRPLRPANCGFIVDWSTVFRDRFQGLPLKGVEFAFGERRLRGEALISRDGLQGSGIYALSAALRDALEATGEAVLFIDLRPNLSADDLTNVLSKPRSKQSLANFLRKTAKLSPLEIGLLQEAALVSPERLTDRAPAALAAFIKAVPIRLTRTASIERAISTAGGIAFDELDGHFMLRSVPGVFAAGEMLDWEAPTGGYLLQACFATGAAAGRGVVEWLQRSKL
jgi:uncharacterized flavoprotein (TIGR03862 family)